MMKRTPDERESRRRYEVDGYLAVVWLLLIFPLS